MSTPPLLVPAWFQRLAIQEGITTKDELRDYARRQTGISDLEIVVVLGDEPSSHTPLSNSLEELATWDPVVRAAAERWEQVLDRLRYHATEHRHSLASSPVGCPLCRMREVTDG